MLGGTAGRNRLPTRFVEGIQDGPALHLRIDALLAARRT
jgi:hypothetical protein